MAKSSSLKVDEGRPQRRGGERRIVGENAHFISQRDGREKHDQKAQFTRLENVFSCWHERVLRNANSEREGWLMQPCFEIIRTGDASVAR